MSALRDRCKAHLGRPYNAKRIDRLVDFVQAEKGRVPETEDKKALVLYFAEERGREEFVKLITAFNPRLIQQRKVG